MLEENPGNSAVPEKMAYDFFSACLSRISLLRLLLLTRKVLERLRESNRRRSVIDRTLIFSLASGDPFRGQLNACKNRSTANERTDAPLSAELGDPRSDRGRRVVEQCQSSRERSSQKWKRAMMRPGEDTMAGRAGSQ